MLDKLSAVVGSSGGSAAGVILFLVVVAVVVAIAGIPAYVICERRRVPMPGIAFIPFVGPLIAILRSIGVTAWAVLLAFIPLVNLLFYLWLAFTVPARHDRSTVWGVGFIIPVVNLFAFYAYAFTMPEMGSL